jgi:ribosomal 30S subunit maturation factor RimM
MTRFRTASAIAAMAALVLAPAAMAAKQVLVIDAPDIRKINTLDGGFKTSDVIGTDVYSNAGKRIGEVRDFMMSRSGHFYAVVDVQDSPIERYLNVDTDNGDVVVVPWRQLREMTQPE